MRQRAEHHSRVEKALRTKRENSADILDQSHHSTGFVEAMHGHMQGHARCYQTQIETNTSIQLSAISPAIPFSIHYAGFVLSRLTMRPDARTEFQYLLGTPYVIYVHVS